MQYLSQQFEDPTGGGDDMVLIYPQWVEVPGVLLVRDKDGEPYECQAVGSPSEVDAPELD